MTTEVESGKPFSRKLGVGKRNLNPPQEYQDTQDNWGQYSSNVTPLNSQRARMERETHKPKPNPAISPESYDEESKMKSKKQLWFVLSIIGVVVLVVILVVLIIVYMTMRSNKMKAIEENLKNRGSKPEQNLPPYIPPPPNQPPPAYQPSGQLPQTTQNQPSAQPTQYTPPMQQPTQYPPPAQPDQYPPPMQPTQNNTYVPFSQLGQQADVVQESVSQEILEAPKVFTPTKPVPKKVKQTPIVEEIKVDTNAKEPVQNAAKSEPVQNVVKSEPVQNVVQSEPTKTVNSSETNQNAMPLNLSPTQASKITAKFLKRTSEKQQQGDQVGIFMDESMSSPSKGATKLNIDEF